MLNPLGLLCKIKSISDDKNMHILQPKHLKLNQKETEEILKKFNLSKSQLPKIIENDPAVPEGCEIGDVIKVERKDSETGELNVYFRVVV